MTTTPRILIADDHPVYRDGLRMLLESTGEVEVVGSARTGDEAVELATALRPDVVVMDLQMPGMDGIEATRRIVADAPEIGVLALTMHEEEDKLAAAMRAGARGYVVKGADQHAILRGIAAVAAGEVIVGPGLAASLATHLHSLTAPARPEVFPQLTHREREVLRLVASGLSNYQIAERLSLAPKTVRNNVSTVFAKLQVTDRAQAIVTARQAGLGA